MGSVTGPACSVSLFFITWLTAMVATRPQAKAMSTMPICRIEITSKFFRVA
jgi:hypothetical protein